MASTSVMFSKIMRKAKTIVAERLTPMAQWTSTRPVGRPKALATRTHLTFEGKKGHLWPSLLSTYLNTWKTDTVLTVRWGDRSSRSHNNLV